MALNPQKTILFLSLACCGFSAIAQTTPITRLDQPVSDAFPLVSSSSTAAVLTDPADFKVVSIATNCLADDIERVTGRKPGADQTSAVIIGTIGHSKLIDGLVASGKFDAAAIKGKWESYAIATVPDPLPGVSSGLVIAGSDRRGTAYGVFDLSETIGVSPWVWWADVAPLHRDALYLSPGLRVQGSPAVKYRGIFINDEDWGLRPWAAKTFEPETGDIGPKTYAKVCELLLRLKANYLWPAMHPGTKAFNFYPQNKTVADAYAIVMGSSHAEPMLRNNVDEWDHAKSGEWDYENNRDSILQYWTQRVKENASFENTYTIGMRGIHDGAMPGGGTMDQKVARLQRVIADQRKILAENVNPQIEKVPQIFVPYKEVLPLYQAGLRVPGDVTLVWPDDNHGYIRRLSNPAEQTRPGGSGVYYHVSYWGAPEDYLWLCTTPPALVWEEMHKAWENGARDLWVLNVGDIKPAEIDMEFFLRLAWNPGAWNENAQPSFLADWAGRNFGAARAADIAAALDESYRLNDPAKPEHLLNARFTDQETQTRRQRFAELVRKTDAIAQQIPAANKDAFYELVVYPIHCSAWMNEKFFGDEPLKAYELIQAETRYFNEKVAGGKWRGIMSCNPRKRPVFEKPAATRAPHGGSATAPAISFEAEKPDRAAAGHGVAWKVIRGLGRSGDSVTLLPTTADVPAAAVLEYDFNAATSSPAKVLVDCIPTHAIHSGRKLRYSVAIDSEPPIVVDIDTAEFSRQWAENVLRAAAIGTTVVDLRAGKHTLKLRPLDPGVVFDRILIDQQNIH